MSLSLVAALPVSVGDGCILVLARMRAATVVGDIGALLVRTPLTALPLGRKMRTGLRRLSNGVRLLHRQVSLGISTAIQRRAPLARQTDPLIFLSPTWRLARVARTRRSRVPVTMAVMLSKGGMDRRRRLMLSGSRSALGFEGTT